MPIGSDRRGIDINDAEFEVSFCDHRGKAALARQLLLLGSGYLDESLGHSISCTAFILLEMLKRPKDDPWPVPGILSDYFCKGDFQD